MDDIEDRNQRDEPGDIAEKRADRCGPATGTCVHQASANWGQQAWQEQRPHRDGQGGGELDQPAGERSLAGIQQPVGEAGEIGWDICAGCKDGLEVVGDGRRGT